MVLKKRVLAKNSVSFAFDTGDAISNLVVLGSYVSNVDAHWVVDHEGALDAPQSSADERSFAGFDKPGFSSCVICVEQYYWMWVGGVWFAEDQEMVTSNIVDDEGCIFEYVYADEFSFTIVCYIDKCAFLDVFGPLDVPPKFHMVAVASCCSEAAVTPGFASRITWDFVAEWMPHVDPVACQRSVDETKLSTKSVIDSVPFL